MKIDVHTHLTDHAFDNDRKEVINRSGCFVLITNGYSPEENRKTLALAKEFSVVKPALGLHPSELSTLSDKDVENEILWIKEQKPVAIGEIGLDFTYGDHDRQINVFRRFLQIAKEKSIPVIVHSRKAEKEVLDALMKESMKRVILHCFTGKINLALQGEKQGYFFSIPPIICYSTHFQELVKRISLIRLLTETDAPYLGPVKGERNEPMNVSIALKEIAELKNMDLNETERAVFMNYQQLF